MSRPGNILLITGIPGIGKTTVIKKAVASLADLTLSGFYSDEIRLNNIRQGFTLVILNKKSIVMAHVDNDSAYRVGKYGVDVAAIDKAAQEALTDNSATDLFIIDEIGKMECFSGLFIKKMTALLDSGKPVVATVAQKGGGLIGAVKKRPGVVLWEITKKNREEIVERIADWARGRDIM